MNHIRKQIFHPSSKTLIETAFLAFNLFIALMGQHLDNLNALLWRRSHKCNNHIGQFSSYSFC
ncbi:hypothetical protein CW304_12660 [Bacillus sp. UFRGS-B20]|nr:hypothetical protein CW304_12660 [Bacillus sp. UFRGS-B20]